MYTKEAREKEVLLFIKYEHNESKLISELGYPSPNALQSQYRKYMETGVLHERPDRKERYTSE